ncbi:MAG: hypothetical protein EG824_13425 [Deltaproteobacteria bacterium]|nr:hypothetical protein [Deltaproteobacteria bacterium]
MVRVAQQIKVAAVFAPGSRIKPVWFEWNRRKHAITETTYFWRDRIGDVTHLHFAVTDGSSLYELSFNTRDQNWTLDAVEGAP